MVNDHTRSAENWKCVWYLLRLDIYIRVYVDSHSLGQLALASKHTASVCIIVLQNWILGHYLLLSITGAGSNGIDIEVSRHHIITPIYG